MNAENGMKTPYVLTCRPGSALRLRISADERHHLGAPINRDHDRPFWKRDETVLTGQEDIRRGLVMTTAEHLSILNVNHTDEECMAYVGNGNLLANPGFVLFRKGKLLHLRDEPVFQQAYASLTSWKNGDVSAEEFWYAQENGHVRALRKWGSGLEDITDKVDFATSGQPLVRKGEAIPIEHLCHLWYDTRHLVRPLKVTLGGADLFLPNAQLQKGLARKAICSPVEIKLEAQVDDRTLLPLTITGWMALRKENSATLQMIGEFLKGQSILGAHEDILDLNVLGRVADHFDSLLQETLARERYEVVDNGVTLQEGQCRYVNHHLQIFFRKAIYPHNIFVHWADGRYGFVLFPGKSGSQGIALCQAQRFLVERLGVEDAILLDNGGDVRLWYRGSYAVPSSEQREEIRSIIAIVKDRAAGWNPGLHLI